MRIIIKSTVFCLIIVFIILSIAPIPILPNNYDVGKIEVGREVSFPVRIFNLGFRPLYLSNVRLSCNCINASPRHFSIWPFTSKTVLIKYDSKNDKGAVKEQIALMFDSNLLFPVKVVDIEATAVKYYNIQNSIINLGNLTAQKLPFTSSVPLNKASDASDGVNLKMGIIDNSNGVSKVIREDQGKEFLDIEFSKSVWGKFREKVSIPLLSPDGAHVGAVSTTIEGMISGDWSADPFYLISPLEKNGQSLSVKITSPFQKYDNLYAEFKPKELNQFISVDLKTFPNVKIMLRAGGSDGDLVGEIKVGSRRSIGDYVSIPIIISKLY